MKKLFLLLVLLLLVGCGGEEEVEPSICDDFNGTMKERCEEQMEYAEIVSSGNVEECEKLDDAEMCVIAIQTEPTDDFDNLLNGECDAIESEGLKSQCDDQELYRQALEELDVEKCEMVEDVEMCEAAVELNIALDADDVELCSTDSCRDSFYNVKAKDDKSYCENIVNERLKELCFEVI